MSIPKKIHYCWFGGAEKPADVKKCIASWRKFCPDFEIIEWDESNFDMKANEYIRGAYENKRWGFVSDYVRCSVVEKYGGVYFDTDVELIRSIDDLLKYKAFFATEDGEHVNTGLGFGSEPKNRLLRAIIEEYNSIDYYKENGKEDLTPCPVRNTKTIRAFYPELDLKRTSIIDDMIFLPIEYFCPLNYETRRLSITKNTRGIHHFSGSWQTPFEKIRRAAKRRASGFVRKVTPLRGRDE